MEKKQLIFNGCVPRLYTTNNGEVQYSLPRKNEQMYVGDLEYLMSLKPNDSNTKAADIWCQLFSNGKRTGKNETTNRIDEQDMKSWNGVVFCDIDTKLYLRYSEKWENKSEDDRIAEASSILNRVVSKICAEYGNIFLGYQLSNSKLGYHFFFYFDCDKTEGNFTKACFIANNLIVHRAFTECRYDDIIDFKHGRSQVLDRCSHSMFQGFYLTSHPLHLSDADLDGKFEDFDNIEVKDTIKQTVGVNYSSIDFALKNTYNIKDNCVNVVRKDKPNKDKIKYISHQIRWRVYESLIVAYNNDKDAIDKEWAYVCDYLVEANGHNKAFYLSEPTKNKWYERFNGTANLSFLDMFGYVIEDKSSYVYQREFEQNNKRYYKHIADELYFYHHFDFLPWIKKAQEVVSQIILNTKRTPRDFQDINEARTFVEDFTRAKEAYMASLSQKSIFDVEYQQFNPIYYYLSPSELVFKSGFTDIEGCEQQLKECRDNYYKKRFDWRKAKEICILSGGVELTKDMKSYTMFADLYYRDEENNYPTIRYDVIHDAIQCYGIDTMSHLEDRVKWHNLVYAHEYVMWRNSNVFSNKAIKTDVQDALDFFVPTYQKYNPITDYLSSVKGIYDEEMLETFFIRHLKADDTPLNRRMTRNFFVAAVKKQFEQTCNFQHMLVLQGESNNGKTFILETLFSINGESYYCDSINTADPIEKNAPKILPNWLIMFGEREGVSKSSANQIKAFIDTVNCNMQWQRKYHNELTVETPRCVLAITTNDSTCIPLDSGVDTDKRHWLIPLAAKAYSSTPEQRKAIRDEKDSIWYTAYQIYQNNPDVDLELNMEEFKALGVVQQDSKVVNNDTIEEYYEDIFCRSYKLNKRGHFKYAQDFFDQVNGENMITDSMIDDNNLLKALYDTDKLKQIPSSWLKEFCCKKWNHPTYELIARRMKKHGWVRNKTCNYEGISRKCWVLE